jgi:hypothetical protein
LPLNEIYRNFTRLAGTEHTLTRKAFDRINRLYGVNGNASIILKNKIFTDRTCKFSEVVLWLNLTAGASTMSQVCYIS